MIAVKWPDEVHSITAGARQLGKSKDSDSETKSGFAFATSFAVEGNVHSVHRLMRLCADQNR